jgi:hypothetical protein
MTNTKIDKLCTAFSKKQRIATGAVLDVAIKVKAELESNPDLQVLFFDDSSGEEFDLDLRGSREELEQRLIHQFPEHRQSDPGKEKLRKGPGRPKLNVVSREVTLLPRHWSWLKKQPGSTSSVLRRLVDEARQANPEKERHDVCQKAVFSFISAIAGDYPGYEEAIRYLFKSDYRRFDQLISSWPNDVYYYAKSFYEGLSDNVSVSDDLNS